MPRRRSFKNPGKINEKILTPDSRQITAHRFYIKVIREEMRHILSGSGAGDVPKRRLDMARAEAASASIRSDSIKGLAQSIAKPAYHRLLSAEPLLRRAVPVLIIAFLITISIGAGVQVLEQRRLAVMDERQTIGALADQIAIEIDRPGARSARQCRPHLR